MFNRKNATKTETQNLKKIELLMTKAHRTEKAEIALPLTGLSLASVFYFGFEALSYQKNSATNKQIIYNKTDCTIF